MVTLCKITVSQQGDEAVVEVNNIFDYLLTGSVRVPKSRATTAFWRCAATMWIYHLDSTNGTFYEEERARAAMLSNGSEFRIGVTVLRLTIEPA